MKKTYQAIIEVAVEFEADLENKVPNGAWGDIGEIEPDDDIYLEGLAMKVIYGNDLREVARTDNNGMFLDFLSVKMEEATPLTGEDEEVRTIVEECLKQLH